jgi:hypothetical protein
MAFFTENRPFDRFDSGEVDRSTYDNQLARVREERAVCFGKLREADTRRTRSISTPPALFWNSPSTGNPSSKSSRSPNVVIFSRGWFVTRASMAEVFDMTYENPSPCSLKCVQRTIGVPT